MPPFWYRLEGTTPVPMEDALAFEAWWKTADRTVARTQIGPVKVSTVFLGLDHSYSEEGPPMLFETMTFAHERALDGLMQRYATWHAAEQGHEAMCENITQRLGL